MSIIDLHTHSIASGHATKHTISDMAKAAYQCGVTLLGISDHGPATIGSADISYFRSLCLLPKKRHNIDVMYGVELNILDYHGTVDLPSEVINKLDYAIISLHPKNIKPGTIEENTSAYLHAMKHPKVRIIGHCDDVKYEIDYRRLVLAAKENNVVIELNNASLQPNSYRGNTYPKNQRVLALCAEYKVPILLGSDSHGIEHIGDTQLAEQLLAFLQFPKELVLNENKDELLYRMQ